MYQLLYEILYERIHTEIDARSSIVVLKNYNIDEIIRQAVPVLYLYTRTKKNETIYLTEVICAIGRAVLQHFGHRQDSALAAKIGAFFLYNLELTQTIHTKKSAGATKHAQYVVEVIKDDDIANLWTHLKTTHIEKLPSTTPYESYTSSLHSTGTKLVKTNAQSVLMSLTPQSHPIVFEAINRAMSTGWLVNERVFSLTSWALKNKTEAFAEIWEQQNPEAKRTKLREASTIIEIASRFLGHPFYHLCYYDFRGRIYPATAFFHHQGADLAKGLLLRADSKPITKEGLDWLFIMLANNWAGKYKEGLKTDKIPLRERIIWARENEEIFISYAENPKVNTGWMSADSPWQFIAACIELYKFRKWQELHRQYINDGIIGEFDYQTHFEAYVDGSNNGSQHLSALTRDEITAPHVNLLKQEYPGDLYAYAAEFCWKYIETEVAKLNPARKGQLEQFIDNAIDYRTQINSALGDRKKELYQEYLAYKKKYKKDYDESAIVFWNRITDLKERRKIVKRGIMTLPFVNKRK